jgi:hypothetical protein
MKWWFLRIEQIEQLQIQTVMQGGQRMVKRMEWQWQLPV